MARSPLHVAKESIDCTLRAYRYNPQEVFDLIKQLEDSPHFSEVDIYICARNDFDINFHLRTEYEGKNDMPLTDDGARNFFEQLEKEMHPVTFPEPEISDEGCYKAKVYFQEGDQENMYIRFDIPFPEDELSG